ncbi:MAG: S8 family serine peptidase, partial [Nevskia sp.]|nr:S8 family serine peptidase [Nevskia sp.]
MDLRRPLAFGALGLLVAGIAGAAARDFEHPASSDTAQQFAYGKPLGPGNVQRQDTPNDPDYDRAEPDDEDGRGSTSLYDERFDLFGFPSQLTPLALYKDGPHALAPMISGFNAAGAWKAERGRPDVVVAILDTGVRWERPGLRRQVHLNCGELPAPQRADGSTLPGAAPGCKEPDKSYDLDGDGALDVDDYRDDPRVRDANGNGLLDAQDLIRAFSDGHDDDHNGFVDDIAGWDFFDDDNDPSDASSYFAAADHGSDRAEQAVEQGNDGAGSIGVCPHCQFLPVRIWDTFVSDGNTFAMGILYATDQGAAVIEGANGSITHSAFAEAASQYAYEHGVVQTYSGDDLNTGNHNYPANYGHALLIQGTVPDTLGLGTNAGSQAAAALAGLPLGTELPVLTYFRGANTTQYGGKSSLAMEGATGSENVAKAAGAAALVVAAGRDAGLRLSPDEVREILEQTAEDVSSGDTLGLGLPDAAQTGWDPHFGYGRADLGAAVALVRSGKIPPEAALAAPDWYAPLTGDSVTITGLARARFASGGAFHWKLEWGAGLAPTSWTTVREGDASGTLTDFGTIDLKAVRAALASYTVPLDPGGPTFSAGALNPYQNQFTVRLTVTAADIPTAGQDRRVFTALADDTLRPGYPRRLGSGGEAPLRYADLDGDNVPELIVPTEDGWLRVYRKDGSDFPGFPVHTQLMVQAAAHTAAPGFAALLQSAPPYEELRGAAVGDLDGDGIPEIVDAAGIHLYVWEPDGSLRPGFPVSLDRDHCRAQDESQPLHHRKCGFVGSPALGHLQGQDHGLDIVVAGLDGYLYAWDGNGRALPGFPVNLVDPEIPADQQMLAESVNDPAIGDLDGDGDDDVVIASNETYGAEPLLSNIQGGLAQAFSNLLAQAAGGSSRVYAVSGKDGHLLPGWPIHLNGGIQSTLPLIGPGHDAALVELGGQQTVVVSTTGGALSVYSADGRLIRDAQQNLYGLASNATDRTGALNLFESASVGDLDGNGTPDLVKYEVTLGQAANLLLVGQNVPYNHLIAAFDSGTGLPLNAFPVVTDDYQFLSSSSIGKLVSGASSQVLAGTGLGLVHAYDGRSGADVAGFPKVTGGWLFAPPELSQDQRLAAITREGYLFEWNVPDAPACQSEWPGFRHDLRSSGNYATDGTPPGAVTALQARAETDGLHVSWIAPGDDGLCPAKAVAGYRVRVDGALADTSGLVPVAPGQTQTLALAGASGTQVTVQAVDAAGNLGYPVTAKVGGGSGGSSGGGSSGGSNSGGSSGGSSSGAAGGGAAAGGG